MTHDQEIENHPFFKKHFAGKSTKEYHEIPHDGGSAGYHQWTAHHGIGLTPVKHKLFHRYHPETNSHSVLLTTGTEGRNILGNHTYHSGEGDGSSATEALEKAIHQYKNDHGFHLQESMDQFASNKREINMKDFRDFVKTTYAGLMEVEGLNESKKEIESFFHEPVLKHEKEPHYEGGTKTGRTVHVYHTATREIRHIPASKKESHYVEIHKGSKMGISNGHTFHDALHDADMDIKD